MKFYNLGYILHNDTLGIVVFHGLVEKGALSGSGVAGSTPRRSGKILLIFFNKIQIIEVPSKHLIL